LFFNALATETLRQGTSIIGVQPKTRCGPRKQKGKFRFNETDSMKECYIIMKATRKSEGKHRKGGLLLSLLCTGVAAIFMGGCAEAPPVTAYDTSYYYPSGNYVRDYNGYTQSYPYQDVPNGPRYRIVAGMHVYEPYYYGSYWH
jgi:hypothetical protein